MVDVRYPENGCEALTMLPEVAPSNLNDLMVWTCLNHSLPLVHRHNDIIRQKSLLSLLP